MLYSHHDPEQFQDSDTRPLEWEVYWIAQLAERIYLLTRGAYSSEQTFLAALDNLLNSDPTPEEAAEAEPTPIPPAAPAPQQTAPHPVSTIAELDQVLGF